MKLSVYSLSTPDMKPAEVVNLAKEYGARGVEWWCHDEGHVDMADLLATARETGRMTREAGLEVAGMAPYFKLDPMEHVERVFEGARALGAHNVRCHTVSYPGDAPLHELMGRFRMWLEPVVSLCGQYDLKLVVEQHHHQIGCTPNACRQLVDGLPPDHVGVIYDPGNALWEGWTGPQYAIDVLGRYLGHVHVKSSKPDAEAERLPPGRRTGLTGAALAEGDIDWRDVLNSLRQAGYEGWLSLEALDARPSQRKICDDLPYLKELLAAL